MRKLLGFGAVGITTCIVLALGGPGSLISLKAAAQAVAEVSVAFVVDFGGTPGVETACVKVPSTDNEYQALAAFTQQEAEASPTYNDSGLLCSIGGVPSSGCGQPDGRGYIYWSYWHGDSGSWVYSSTGAFGTVHSCTAQGTSCDVEGWKFEDPGSGNPTDPPPQSPPDYQAICAAGTAPTTTSATSAPPTTSAAPTTTSSVTPVSRTTVPGVPASPSGSGSMGSGGNSATASSGQGASTGSVGDNSASPTTPSASAAAAMGVAQGAAAPQSAPAGGSEPSPTSNAALAPLASTGFGPGVRWTGLIGSILLTLGVGCWITEGCRRRMRRALMPSGSSIWLGGRDGLTEHVESPLVDHVAQGTRTISTWSSTTVRRRLREVTKWTLGR